MALYLETMLSINTKWVNRLAFPGRLEVVIAEIVISFYAFEQSTVVLSLVLPGSQGTTESYAHYLMLNSTRKLHY